MGLRCISLSFRIDSQEAIVGVHEQVFPGRRALVSPSLNGWVTLLDERLDSFQKAEIIGIASSVCVRCDCPAIALAVLHSDYFYLWLFDALGQLVTQFSSEPGVECSRPPEEVIPELVDVLHVGASREALLNVLTQHEIFADHTLWAFGELLGIRHLGLSYGQAITEWDDIDDNFQPGWARFQHLPPRGVETTQRGRKSN
jgi:hypothetical protein